MVTPKPHLLLSLTNKLPSLPTPTTLSHSLQFPDSHLLLFYLLIYLLLSPSLPIYFISCLMFCLCPPISVYSYWVHSYQSSTEFKLKTSFSNCSLPPSLLTHRVLYRVSKINCMLYFFKYFCMVLLYHTAEK